MFYDNFKAIQDKYHIQPEIIFDVHKTDISTVQRSLKILAAKGSKQIGRATNAERRSTTTVWVFNATGQYIAPDFYTQKEADECSISKK